MREGREKERGAGGALRPWGCLLQTRLPAAPRRPSRRTPRPAAGPRSRSGRIGSWRTRPHVDWPGRSWGHCGERGHAPVTDGPGRPLCRKRAPTARGHSARTSCSVTGWHRARRMKVDRAPRGPSCPQPRPGPGRRPDRQGGRRAAAVHTGAPSAKVGAVLLLARSRRATSPVPQPPGSLPAAGTARCGAEPSPLLRGRPQAAPGLWVPACAPQRPARFLSNTPPTTGDPGPNANSIANPTGRGSRSGRKEPASWDHGPDRRPFPAERGLCVQHVTHTTRDAGGKQHGTLRAGS